MGVVIVGPSGSGKTTLWKILQKGMLKIGQVVKQYTMNPKAMPRTQVSIEFGKFQYICFSFLSPSQLGTYVVQICCSNIFV
jgi:ABC-type ATPase involved in cell division